MKGTENEARLLLLTGENLFADAVHSVMIRSGSNVSGKTSRSSLNIRMCWLFWRQPLLYFSGAARSAQADFQKRCF